MSPPPASEARVVILGAGAIGLSLAAWLAPRFPRLALVARGESLSALRAEGLRFAAREDPLRSVPVEVLPALDPEDRPDLLLLTVKTWSLEALAPRVVEAWGPALPVIGVQNGLDSADLLRAHFQRPLHGIATWNAWRVSPGVVRYERQGALVIGAVDPESTALAEAWAARLSEAMLAPFTARPEDAAWCKALVNLANSVTALAGFGLREVEDRRRVLPFLLPTLDEGLRVLEAAGVQEHPLPDLPRWRLLRMGRHLPRWLHHAVAARQLRKMTHSSMGQDLASEGGHTELEAINGAFLALAEAHGVATPTLRAVTELARERFAEPGFRGLPMEELEAELRRRTS
ncbi:MAG: ketopantoate reductase family protein [Alphaproteobacteria bacterium]|nr:ketopantoate reductase family protein [Alphaproteobacteria bacterium]